MHRVALSLTLIASLAALWTVPAAGQGSVGFDTPTASGDFGEPTRFRTTFRSGTAPDRVELVLRLPGEGVDRVNVAAVEHLENDRYRATALQGGHVVPNTRYDYHFRALLDDELAIGPEATYRVEDRRMDWRVLEDERVNVWWHEGDEAFARRALDIGAAAIDDAASLLGVTDVDPVDFIIYSDQRMFREAMGPATRENVGGQAHPSIQTLFGLIEPHQIDSDWVEELVVHELAHLVFDAAVDNPYQYPPRWLNEGLAVYLSKGFDGGDRAQVERAAGSDSIIPLQGLVGQFPTRALRIGLAYAESAAAVDYFVATYGEEQLVELITAFADGTGLDGAFLRATGADFAAFDDAWLASLGTAQPEPFGPRRSAPGPTPAAWAEEAAPLLR